MQPKLIKGPDVFVKTIERLKGRVPELYAVICGPARGYVVSNLARLGVPYRHLPHLPYEDIPQVFQALDLYLITARDEGGPKAVLESMASGIPLVTTRVGQAVDLVRHGENAWMADVEDVDGLAHWAAHALERRGGLGEVLRAGRGTAEANSYEAQVPLWREFFEGFLETR
jgi:glycosyltransferase involved in cell wall biosynthesis